MKVTTLETLKKVFNKHNIDYEKGDNDFPDIGDAIYEGIDCYYINKSNYENYNKEKVKSLFPIVYNDITLNLVDVLDMEIEDDRVIKACIIFSFYESI